MGDWAKDGAQLQQQGRIRDAINLIGRAGKLDDTNGIYRDLAKIEQTRDAGYAKAKTSADRKKVDDWFKKTGHELIQHHLHHKPGLFKFVANFALNPIAPIHMFGGDWAVDGAHLQAQGKIREAIDLIGHAGKIDDVNGIYRDLKTLEDAKAEGLKNAAQVQPAAAQAAAVKRVNDEFARLGHELIQHHLHHKPGPFKWIASAVASAGKFASDVGHMIGKVPGLSVVLNAALHIIPGVSSVTGIMDTCMAVGKIVVDASQTIQAAIKAVGPALADGFHVATGIMTHAGLTTEQFNAIRNNLDSNGKKGFDAAISLHIGRINNPAPPSMPPAQAAGWAMTHGMVGAMPAQKTMMMKEVVAAHPEVTAGAAKAGVAILDKRASLWHRILQTLHLEAKTP